MVEKKHLEYWQKRVDEIIRYADQIDIDVFAEIARIYLEEAKLVQKELFAFYQRFADDNGLTLQEAMYQLRHEDMSDYQQNAKRYFEQAEKDPELLKRLNEQYASARATRMDLLNLELTWRAGVLAASISSTFENHLLKTAKYAYRKAGDRRGTINEPALRELIRTPINGKNYSEHIWGNVDKLAEDLREVFRRGFIRGLHPREMAQEIAKKYNVARSRAQTIIRTDGTAIISNSVAKRYMDAGLKYYRILVHLDDRTTDICRQIAKKDERFELSEMKVGVNAPPFHYNCRSGIVPDEDELDGGIKLDSSYHTEADPIRELMGSAFESHLEETEKLINELKAIGVEVIFSDAEDMVYQASLNKPGQIRIDKQASYSALLHEYTHAIDDAASGWQGLKYLYDDEKFIEFETHAYDVELSFYRLNKVPEEYIIRLEKLKEAEIKRIKRRWGN